MQQGKRSLKKVVFLALVLCLVGGVVSGISTEAKSTKTSITSISSPKAGQIKVKYKKVSGRKYQVQISRHSNMKSSKSWKTSSTTKTISDRKQGQKYYVRVRTYKGKSYSKWSKIKTVKVKKEKSNVYIHDNLAMEELDRSAYSAVFDRVEKNETYVFVGNEDEIEEVYKVLVNNYEQVVVHYDEIKQRQDDSYYEKYLAVPESCRTLSTAKELSDYGYALKFDADNWKEVKEYREYLLRAKQAVVQAGVKDGMDKKTAVNKIAKWLSKNISYDYTYKGANCKFFSTRKGVCRDYAAAFVKMCQIANINDVQYITGQGYSSKSWGSHAWCRVKISGTWYWIDPTWMSTTKNTKKYGLTKSLWKDHKDAKVGKMQIPQTVHHVK